jgi:hypothetical protein
MIKSKSMKCAGYVVHLGRRGMHVGFLWEIQKERTHWEGIDYAVG